MIELCVYFVPVFEFQKINMKMENKKKPLAFAKWLFLFPEYMYVLFYYKFQILC